MASKKSTKKASPGAAKKGTPAASKSSKKAASPPSSTDPTGTKVSNEPLPDKIFAQVSPRSVGGVSMFEAQGQINSETVMNFFSEGEVIQAAVAYLQEAGFEVLQISPLTINIVGTAAAYRKAFNTDVVVKDVPVIKEMGKQDMAQFIDSPETALMGLIDPTGTRFENVIEGIAFEERRYPMAASMYAPLKSYWHLRVPGDVSLGCNADRAHRAGITGRGVKVAMVDSGHFRHPYFVGRGYNIAPVTLGPGATFPLRDESGHGTGESANIFAVAPDVQLFPVKIDQNFVNTTGAFNAAVGLKPDIITCSWGSSRPNSLTAADQALATSVAAAVAAGIIVIFSAGNGHWGFPGQHPDVISAGGVFMDKDESLRASDYSSGFMSNIYPNRRVPDLSGLVGMQPGAKYIMLPVEPGDQIDVSGAGGTHPNGDETANNDGWSSFSGTSAAAPQLAGAAALIKEACPKLKPVQVRDILMKTARDVTTGRCHPNTGQGAPGVGNPATVGPDTATGHGLVDAHKAALLAKLQCISTPILPGPGPITPGPITPTPIKPGPGPITPGPITPINPGPITPISPGPIKPIQPTPIQPPKPIAPIINPGPIFANRPSPPSPGAQGGGGAFSESGAEAGGQQEAAPQLTSEMAEALTEMIVNSDFNE